MRVLALLILCGCYLQRYPVTPAVAETSVYRVYVVSPDGLSQGTAWSVDAHHLVTAGHVCQGGLSFVIESPLGRHFPATPVVWELSETLNGADVCVLRTDAPLAPGLVIADEMPHPGVHVEYTGFPLGKFVHNEGLYLGDLDTDGHANDDVISAPCDHGASGSPAYSRRGVFGVVISLRTDGGEIRGVDGCVVAPLKELRAVLDDAGVKYDVTPDGFETVDDVYPPDLQHHDCDVCGTGGA